MKLIRVDRTPLTENLFKSLEESGHTPNGTESWFTVQDGEKNIMLFSLQRALVIGPFIKIGEATKHEVAVGLKEASIIARVLAQTEGIANVLVFSQDESIQKFAQSVGMEQMPDTAFVQSTI